MKISSISSINYNKTGRIQSFRANSEIPPISENKSQYDARREKAFKVLAVVGIITLATIFDFIQKKYHDSKTNDTPYPVLTTNDTFQITKDMEDTYQTVLSNKLQKAERYMPKIEFYRIKESLRRLDKFSNDQIDLVP